MEEKKGEKHYARSRIYDVINISRKGQDIIVIVLASLLFITIIAAVALAK